MKVLAVGDIHTKVWIIKEIEKIIGDYDAIVFVGDYADDWGATPQMTINTWAHLKDLQERYADKVNVVMGNHDYIYVNYTKTISSGYSKFTQTLIDMPESRDLREWLRNLPVILELDGVTYSHAGLTNTFEQEYTSKWLWEDDSPLWARPLLGTFYLEMPQVFGHTPCETCYEVQENIWCIDTFSTYPEGDLVGDQTVLEILDGKKFTKRKIKNDDDNSNSLKERLS